MNRRLINILKKLFLTFFQNFNSIIAVHAKENKFRNLQLQVVPVEVHYKNNYRG